MEFVNEDQIAQGLSAFPPEGHAVEAGRIMLSQLRKMASASESFAFESTLASRSFAPWLSSLRESQGYEFRLLYVWLPSVEINFERVAARFALGGHSVPVETIRRRYFRSVQNLFDLYVPLADLWEVFDNTEQAEPKLLASGRFGEEPVVVEPSLWAKLRSQYDSR